MPWTVESIEELKKYMNSKAQFIETNGINGRLGSKEAIQAMFHLTLVLPDDKKKLGKAEF